MSWISSTSRSPPPSPMASREPNARRRSWSYDLGGGTFDVSVIRVDQEGVRILVTGGNHELGGKDWDDRLITYLANAFAQENGVNPLTDPHAHQELRTKAEATKRRLSQKMKDPFTFSFRRATTRESKFPARSSKRSPPTCSI